MPDLTYNLVMTRSDGRTVCAAEITQAQFDSPGTLEGAVAKMRTALAAMPEASPLFERAHAALNLTATVKGVHGEHVDPAPRPIRDNPQA